MELPVEQALRQGIAAHKEGKLQDAERFYRAILQSQPTHPDANHNLGILAVSSNEAQVALTLFKIALEANPKIEQFWLSYINTLVKVERLKDAKQAIEEAKKKGFDAEKLDALLSQSRDAPDTKVPLQTQLNSLLECYKTKRFSEAEKLAVSITQEFPKQVFPWVVLGSILAEAGRDTESAHAKQKVVSLSPQNSDAHFNLGNTLKKLGKLDAAEISYKQAIELKPGYAEAHCNLGTTLQELGRLDEAEANYKQAIELKPDFVEAHSNLGATLKALGKLKDSETSYKQAIALNPNLAEPYSNLGTTLQELGRLDEAETNYKQAIELNPENFKAHCELLNCLYLLDKKTAFFNELDSLIDQGKVNATIGSLACRSAMKYGVVKPNLFCRKPLDYVLHTDLKARHNFEDIFVKKAKHILTEKQISNREQSLLLNGSQTSGNLFDIKTDFTNAIQKIIRFEIDLYRTNFKHSKEGLIKDWPTEYSLYGWLISMKSGGEIQPHIHEQGWLSGSVYINVPQKLGGDSGKLVVSLGEEKDATDTRINVKKVINVVTGSMVLFPASLMHHTIPFESEEERIVLAFDVKKL